MTIYNARQVHRPESWILDAKDCAAQHSYYSKYMFSFVDRLPDMDFKFNPPVNDDY